jgi:hypothetical protein
VLGSLKFLVRPRRVIPLLMGAVVVFGAAIDASWMRGAAIVLAVLLVLTPLLTPVSTRARSRFSNTGPVGRLAAGAADGAASKWFALGGLAVFSAREDSAQPWLGLTIVAFGVASLALATIALKPATRGDLRLNLDSVRVSRSLPWALCALSLATTLSIVGLAVWPSRFSGAVAFLTGGLFVGGAFFVLRRLVYRNTYRETTRVRIEGVGARFAIHISGPANSSYQLATWLPLFEKLG